MWTKFLRLKKRKEIVALFHELHPDPVFCSEDQWAQLRDCGFETNPFLAAKLKEKKLLIESQLEDNQEFEKVEKKLNHQLNQPTILYLSVAGQCNLNCGYCPIPEASKSNGQHFLAEKKALAGIDLWQAHLHERHDSSLQYYVIFYGGEPLLNKRTIKASLSYIKTKTVNGSLPPDLNVMIATNGLLIDNETIQLCKEYNILVAVGLDGSREANDALRVDAAGKGSYDLTIAAIKKLIQAGIRTFASVSITPFNMNQISGYSSFFYKLGVEKIGFNFLKGRLLLVLVGQAGLENYYRQASRGIIENSLNQKIPGFEYLMEKKQAAFDNGIFYPVDCTCYGNQIVIQADGQISNCPFFRTRLGDIESVHKDFRIWDQPIIQEWRKRLPLYHPGEAKALSGGGCAWSSYELKGSPLETDDSSKIFSEEVLNDLIWRRYEKT